MPSKFYGRWQGRPKINIPPVVVIGLGRFGSAVAEELMDNGVEVQGIDSDAKVVNDHAHLLTECAQADSTDVEALKQLGVPEMERVVLAIGSNLEASILTASNLVEMGISNIWAKADSSAHARILTQLGVHHVVHPERDTGRRVAHLLRGTFQDFALFGEDFGMIKMRPPKPLRGHPIDLQALWKQHHVGIVSVRVGTGHWTPFIPDAHLTGDDLIIVAGKPDDLERFSEL